MSKNDYMLDRLKEHITQLSPEQRSILDDYMVGALAGDAETQRTQYGLELAVDYLDEAHELVKQWGKMQGLSSYYPSIDAMTKGFVAGEVTVIGGATSNGKTTLAVNICARMVAHGIPVLFVTLEMTKAQLTSRMMFVQDNFEDFAGNLSYQSADEMNWQSIDGLIAGAVQQLGVKMVIIDHLHYFTRELQNVAEDLGRITKEFKKNAQRHNIPIILISHTRKGQGNDINDLRGSSYIAQDADIVLMVSRPEDYPSQFLVSIQKNRNRGFDANAAEKYFTFDKTRIIDDMDTPWNTSAR